MPPQNGFLHRISRASRPQFDDCPSQRLRQAEHAGALKRFVLSCRVDAKREAKIGAVTLFLIWRRNVRVSAAARCTRATCAAARPFAATGSAWLEESRARAGWRLSARSCERRCAPCWPRALSEATAAGLGVAPSSQPGKTGRRTRAAARQTRSRRVRARGKQVDRPPPRGAISAGSEEKAAAAKAGISTP